MDLGLLIQLIQKLLIQLDSGGKCICIQIAFIRILINNINILQVLFYAGQKK